MQASDPVDADRRGAAGLEGCLRADRNGEGVDLVVRLAARSASSIARAKLPDSRLSNARAKSGRARRDQVKRLA